MPDLTALKAALDGGPLDSLCDAAIRAGSNAELLRLLHEPRGAQKRRRPISLDDFQDALGAETSPEIESRLLVLAQRDGDVPVHRAGFIAWMDTNLSTAVRDKITEFSEVRRRPIDTFLSADEEAVSIRDIRKVVAQIAKSHVRQAGTPDNGTRAALINSCGVKIRSLRGKMPSTEYVAFRNSLYAIHGADQADTDALRAATIDLKVTEVTSG